MKFSESTGQIYLDGIDYPTIPEDAVEITEGEYYQIVNKPMTSTAVVRDGHVKIISLELKEKIEPPKYFKHLTQKQLRLTLLKHGITGAVVLEKIKALKDPVQREAANIEWEFADRFFRDSPTLVMLGKMLGFTDEQIDAMWEEAAKL